MHQMWISMWVHSHMQHTSRANFSSMADSAGPATKICRQLSWHRTTLLDFNAGATIIDKFLLFWYLGQWMLVDDSDTMAISQNILKARMQWGQLCWLLTSCGASRHILFYKAAIMASRPGP